MNVSCKKYPDGPWLSLHSKEVRLCKSWDVSYFSINGYDSTPYLKNQPFYGKYRFERRKDDHSLFPTNGICFYDCNNINYYGEGN